MRINFVLAAIDVNGGTKVIAEYGRHLLALGHDVRFISITDPEPGLLARLKNRLKGERPHVRSTEYFDDMADRVIYLTKSQPLDYARFPEADFLIATWWETVEWANGAPASAGRLVHLMQGYEMFPFQPHDRVAKVYAQDILRVAVSDWIADQVEKHHGSKTAAVIHNSIDAEFFAMKPAMNPGGLRLGFIDSPFEGKNTRIIPQVYRNLQCRGIDCDMVTFYVHPVEHGDEAPLPLERHHRPAQTMIPKLYQSCDLWLWPSLEEGFGLPVLEALSCGTPVVAGPAGAAPQLIRTGVNGYLTDGTTEEFTDAVEAYTRLPPAERAAMSKAARETVTTWRWKDAVLKFEAVLKAHL